MLGAERKTDEPYGLAIRTYVESPRHADEYLEASLAMRDANGTPIPGYGWMFPTGNGTVNLGVGALSTMKGFRKLNLNTLCDIYRDSIADEWEVGPYLEKPRAWRLPMTSQSMKWLGRCRGCCWSHQSHERGRNRLQSRVRNADL